MITLGGVSKRYGEVAALRDVNLEVPPGSIFGIIGKSGAGKSTLLRIMSLLERPDAGEVRYRGERVESLEGRRLLERRRRMGMIFQNFNLFSSRNAAGNIACPLEIAGFPRREINRRVDELMDLTGIADKRKARLRELSGGQKQRVAIARALAAKPELLFCDEATSALDPQTTRSILALIRDLREALGFTVVLITHQLEVIRQICGEVAVMDQGCVVERGSVEAVFTSPSSDAARELLHE